jgi:uncharacterized protein
MKIRFAVLVVAIILIALVGGYAWQMNQRSARAVLTPGKILTVGTMRFEIADTQPLQQQGLSGRMEIPEDYGMLFVFPTKDRFGFWMKDMLTPIDIVFLNDDGSIVLIDHSVPPSTYPEIFYPPVPVKYVLETKAGYATAHGWDVGTKIALPPPYGQ